VDQPAFINFLEYLLYFKEKDYARFIQFVLLGSPLNPHFKIISSYPHALHHLELLQHAQFRADMRKDEFRDLIHQKQFDHWRTNRSGGSVEVSTGSIDDAAATMQQ
jgi:mediator of RNA polymerase II transcription subunit 31